MTKTRMNQKISVIGLGYIGLPTAAVFASHDVQVLGVDVNADTVETINQGRIHIAEHGLDQAVALAVSSGKFRASQTPEPADAFLIAVPTPFQPDDHSADLKYVKAAAQNIAPVLAPGNLIVLESTSPVGTTERMAEWLAEARPDLSFPQHNGVQSDIRIAYCPERVLPGKIIAELVSNDRLIGGMTPLCAQQAVQLYETFVKGACIVTDTRTAEMAKLTENSFRDVNIAFANELSVICDKLGMNVWELIGLANRHPRVNILQPGPGVGGHCIAVDPWFIVSSAPEQARLIRTAREVNDDKPRWVLDKIKSTLGAFLVANPDKTAANATIACYGLAFKPDIDDLRESPALEIAQAVAAWHAGQVVVVEPNIDQATAKDKALTLVSFDRAQQADIHVLLVDHSDFKTANTDRMSSDYVVDTRGIWL